MKNLLFSLFLLGCLVAQSQEKLIYHNIHTDKKGNLLPWYNNDPGTSYDHVINLVWYFWDTMRIEPNGLPYYMNHQVWNPGYDDQRGLGGDQLQMALSSWGLLYAYSGNERVKQNMKFIADYYLTHGFTPADCQWPNVPFPYNTMIYSGIYDGDMVIGKDYLQPDKAGSLGLELVHLHKMSKEDFYFYTTTKYYLDAAVKIANTLVAHMKDGDEKNSPLPFKVNAFTGKTGRYAPDESDTNLARYTTNWAPSMELFLELIEMKKGKTADYQSAFDKLLNWMKQYPMQNNEWGPFFEDGQGWSQTQINATTFARFILEHKEYFPDWKKDVTKIFDWVYKILGNKHWEKYGVVVVNEQTVYQTPAQSHTSRQAATELLYCFLSGDSTRKTNAIRQLNWATYMVDHDGKNRFPQDENWLTDGYGDYVRHYLRAMAVYPELSPSADHILSTTSTIQQASYKIVSNPLWIAFLTPAERKKLKIFYRTFDLSGEETIRMTKKPSKIFVEEKQVFETTDILLEGFSWKPIGTGGVLTINRIKGNYVTILE